MTHVTADYIDWEERLDAAGIQWYCGFVFPVTNIGKGGLSGDDIAALPRCDRWHPTREERENCDHGIDTTATDGTPCPPVDPPPPTPGQEPDRPNRHDGRCYWCGGTVLANEGRVTDIHGDGMLVPVHVNGGCS